MEKMTTMQQLREKSEKGSLVALFYASWCPYCRAFLPIFDAHDGKTKVPLLKVQIDEEENPMWDEFSINAVPTLIFFRDGKVFARADAKPGIGLKENDLNELLKKV
ncbi:thioredoxin family protein [Candidatus Micrarchaeota archaeon]|nr:thioredoxin family protein [Candidatus Micrarchaeota archaeon]